MWRCNEKISGGAGVTNAISVKERLQPLMMILPRTRPDRGDGEPLSKRRKHW